MLIGGGHAHALLLRRWGMRPLPGARLTVINPDPTAPYTGMLPGHIAGHYGRDDLEIDLVRLARYAGARLVLGRVEGLDPAERRVFVPGRPPIAYDVASIDIGITAEMPDIPGFAVHGIAAKPLGPYAARWQRFLAEVAAGRRPPRAAVIGGGVAGVELALAMAHALRGQGTDPQVALVEREARIGGTGALARARLMRALRKAGIRCHFNAEVRQVGPEALRLKGGAILESSFTVGAAGAFPQRWLEQTGLPLSDGFIDVDASLQVVDHPGLFACGDCANLTASPRPKAGVFAVRAAPVLYDNLRAALSGGKLRPFRPQRRYLKLVSLGGKSALAEKWGLAPAGPLLWRWKDWIDRRFMERFGDLPEMSEPKPPRRAATGVAEMLADVPLCGGCGAKVGGTVLTDSLCALPTTARADVLTGAGDDSAVLQVGGVRQVLTTDHLRAFTDDPVTMARITALHAMGDIWAMGAKPQAALSSITLPRMAAGLQARTMAEIMEAASQVFAEAGAEIVGGHSTMGDEMTLGFTVTGLCEGAAITQGGGQPGDALILTRPIGSGVLLAAEMAGAARGRDVAGLLAAMQQPQGRAAGILRGAHAMTDVTGFGLAGHLAAICRASGCGAEIELEAVPFYPGALELAREGRRSTLLHANRAAAPLAGPQDARADLLHDPQTAGGLLAAVPEAAAERLLAELRAAGFPAVRIGQLTPPPELLRLV
ncbi:selenide, water dikinase SelD [Frigidibacter sp. ROC022]|uniref:selenide, water dikinase SelD n=1 Tax=Frigidibacter sp. ROC022 TaxID=2971796 RepID=UPI00215A7299|nr:selenide, water dikinase SelD [Frigidibacter sp. ROC022]